MPSRFEWDPKVWPQPPDVPHGSSRANVGSDWLKVVTQRVPLNKDDPDKLQDYIKSAAYAVNYHRHTHTCKKGGRHGGHYDCRMNFDMPLVPATCRLDHSSFAVKREDGLLVPSVPALLLAGPANHVMQLTCEASRFLRHAKLYQDAKTDTDIKVRT